MAKSLKCATALSALLLSLAACRGSRDQESAVIQLLKDSGSGDLSAYTRSDLQHWFAIHEKLAQQVVGMCQHIATRSVASWQASQEGNACAVAQQTVAFFPTKMKADQRGW